MTRSSRNVFITIVIVFQIICIFGPARYAGAEQSFGLTVSPAELSLSVSPTSPTQETTLTIANSYAVDVSLKAELQSIDESGVRLLPNGQVDSAIADALRLSATDITIPAKSTYTLKVYATSTEELSDGGHYASLVLTQRSGTTESAVQPAVAVGIFLTKDQNIRRNLQLTNVKIDKTLFTLPKTVRLTFNNLGNTHVIPRASVGIYDGDELIAKGIVNNDSKRLLPGQHSNFSSSIDWYRRPLSPRKLLVKITYRIDGLDVQLVKTQTSWYVPPIDALALIFLIVILWICRSLPKRLVLFFRKKRRLQLHKTAGVKDKIIPRGTTKRILGRTVIRTHQAAMRVSERLNVQEIAPSQHKQIPITVVETVSSKPAELEKIKPQKIKVVDGNAKSSVSAKKKSTKAPKKTATKHKQKPKNSTKTAKQKG